MINVFQLFWTFLWGMIIIVKARPLQKLGLQIWELKTNSEDPFIQFNSTYSHIQVYYMETLGYIQHENNLAKWTTRWKHLSTTGRKPTGLLLQNTATTAQFSKLSFLLTDGIYQL